MRNEPCHGCEHVIYPYPYDPAFVCDSQLRCGYHGGTAEVWCEIHPEHPNYVPLLEEADDEDSRSQVPQKEQLRYRAVKMNDGRLQIEDCKTGSSVFVLTRTVSVEGHNKAILQSLEELNRNNH